MLARDCSNARYDALYGPGPAVLPGRVRVVHLVAGPAVRVHVGIPWRAGDPWREQAFAYVQIHLRGAGLDPVPYDNGADIFSRAGSRNLAVRCADADVVILHDADMVLPAAAYLEAAELALSSDRLVIGFNRYRPLSKARTVEAFAGSDPFTLDPVDELVDFSVGGCSPSRRSAGGRLAAWTSGTSTGAVRTSRSPTRPAQRSARCSVSTGPRSTCGTRTPATRRTLISRPTLDCSQEVNDDDEARHPG